jgi:hypothetical protein
MAKDKLNPEEERKSQDFWMQMSKLLQDPDTRRQIIEALFNEAIKEENTKGRDNGLQR